MEHILKKVEHYKVWERLGFVEGEMKLKVWGGLIFVEGKQIRTIVATRTKKRACEILRMSLYEFNTYWSETGNKKELEIALKFPNTVFIAIDDREKIFKRCEVSK